MRFSKQLVFLANYLFPTGNCPIIGDVTKIDCIWTQAFGRNSIPDANLGEVIKYEREFENESGHPPITDAVLFRRLFTEHGMKGGEPNLELAHLVMDYLTANERLVAISQWEVNFELWRWYTTWYTKNAHRIISIWPPPDKPYFNSMDVISEAARIAKEKDLKRPLILAQDWHKPRCVAIAWKLGWNVCTDNSSVPQFDRKCIQPHAKSLSSFLPREIAARWIHHRVYGWVKLLPPSGSDA